MTALIWYDAACRALADAKLVDEAKEIRDKAEAVRAYARQAKNRQLETDAAEIRVRAERRLGELIAAQKAAGGLNEGTRGQLAGRDSSGGAVVEPPEADLPTLADIGIDKKFSSRSQRLAVVPKARFEAMISKWRDRVADEAERITVDLLRADARREARPPAEFPTIDEDLPVDYCCPRCGYKWSGNPCPGDEDVEGAE